jgi:hypothetical protein
MASCRSTGADGGSYHGGSNPGLHERAGVVRRYDADPILRDVEEAGHTIQRLGWL